MIIRVGTRRSRLALAQTNIVIKLLEAAHSNLKCEIVEIETSGDIMLDKDLSKIGGKGLFLKEIENALVKGDIDIAMHSLKDVPTQMPEGLEICAYLKRDNPTDCLVSALYKSLAELPHGARVGTSSLRRKYQLLRLRPDLNIEFMRGNVDTRVRKVEMGEFDAAVMATAGLERLSLYDKITEQFSVKQMVPAPAQGIVCVEAKSGSEAASIVAPIDNERSRHVAGIEREFMALMDGGCTLPFGAYLTDEDDLHTYYYDESAEKTHRYMMADVKDTSVLLSVKNHLMNNS